MRKRFEQLFKRVPVDDTPILTMPQEYQDGWYAGALAARDAQRKADIEVAENYFVR